MIDHDAAVIRRAVTAHAAEAAASRLHLAAILDTLAGGRFLDRLDTQLQAAGYTPTEARRIVDEALAAENRRRPATTRRPSAPTGPRILTVDR